MDLRILRQSCNECAGALEHYLFIKREPPSSVTSNASISLSDLLTDAAAYVDELLDSICSGGPSSFVIPELCDLYSKLSGLIQLCYDFSTVEESSSNSSAGPNPEKLVNERGSRRRLSHFEPSSISNPADSLISSSSTLSSSEFHYLPPLRSMAASSDLRSSERVGLPPLHSILLEDASITAFSSSSFVGDLRNRRSNRAGISGVSYEGREASGGLDESTATAMQRLHSVVVYGSSEHDATQEGVSGLVEEGCIDSRRNACIALSHFVRKTAVTADEIMRNGGLQALISLARYASNHSTPGRHPWRQVHITASIAVTHVLQFAREHRSLWGSATSLSQVTIGGKGGGGGGLLNTNAPSTLLPSSPSFPDDHSAPIAQSVTDSDNAMNLDTILHCFSVALDTALGVQQESSRQQAPSNSSSRREGEERERGSSLLHNSAAAHTQRDTQLALAVSTALMRLCLSIQFQASFLVACLQEIITNEAPSREALSALFTYSRMTPVLGVGGGGEEKDRARTSSLSKAAVSVSDSLPPLIAKTLDAGSAAAAAAEQGGITFGIDRASNISLVTARAVKVVMRSIWDADINSLGDRALPMILRLVALVHSSDVDTVSVSVIAAAPPPESSAADAASFDSASQPPKSGAAEEHPHNSVGTSSKVPLPPPPPNQPPSLRPSISVSSTGPPATSTSISATASSAAASSERYALLQAANKALTSLHLLAKTSMHVRMDCVQLLSRAHRGLGNLSAAIDWHAELGEALNAKRNAAVTGAASSLPATTSTQLKHTSRTQRLEAIEQAWDFLQKTCSRISPLLDLRVSMVEGDVCSLLEHHFRHSELGDSRRLALEVLKFITIKPQPDDGLLLPAPRRSGGSESSHAAPMPQMGGAESQSVFSGQQQKRQPPAEGKRGSDIASADSHAIGHHAVARLKGAIRSRSVGPSSASLGATESSQANLIELVASSNGGNSASLPIKSYPTQSQTPKPSFRLDLLFGNGSRGRLRGNSSPDRISSLQEPHAYSLASAQTARPSHAAEGGGGGHSQLQQQQDNTLTDKTRIRSNSDAAAANRPSTVASSSNQSLPPPPPPCPLSSSTAHAALSRSVSAPELPPSSFSSKPHPARGTVGREGRLHIPSSPIRAVSLFASESVLAFEHVLRYGNSCNFPEAVAAWRAQACRYHQNASALGEEDKEERLPSSSSSSLSSLPAHYQSEREQPLHPAIIWEATVASVTMSGIVETMVHCLTTSAPTYDVSAADRVTSAGPGMPKLRYLMLPQPPLFKSLDEGNSASAPVSPVEASRRTKSTVGGGASRPDQHTISTVFSIATALSSCSNIFTRRELIQRGAVALLSAGAGFELRILRQMRDMRRTLMREMKETVSAKEKSLIQAALEGDGGAGDHPTASGAAKKPQLQKRSSFSLGKGPSTSLDSTSTKDGGMRSLSSSPPNPPDASKSGTLAASSSISSKLQQQQQQQQNVGSSGPFVFAPYTESTPSPSKFEAGSLGTAASSVSYSFGGGGGSLSALSMSPSASALSRYMQQRILASSSGSKGGGGGGGKSPSAALRTSSSRDSWDASKPSLHASSDLPQMSSSRPSISDAEQLGISFSAPPTPLTAGLQEAAKAGGSLTPSRHKMQGESFGSVRERIQSISGLEALSLGTTLGSTSGDNSVATTFSESLASAPAGRHRSSSFSASLHDFQQRPKIGSYPSGLNDESFSGFSATATTFARILPSASGRSKVVLPSAKLRAALAGVSGRDDASMPSLGDRHLLVSSIACLSALASNLTPRCLGLFFEHGGVSIILSVLEQALYEEKRDAKKQLDEKHRPASSSESSTGSLKVASARGGGGGGAPTAAGDNPTPLTVQVLSIISQLLSRDEDSAFSACIFMNEGFIARLTELLPLVGCGFHLNSLVVTSAADFLSDPADLSSLMASSRPKEGQKKAHGQLSAHSQGHRSTNFLRGHEQEARIHLACILAKVTSPSVRRMLIEHHQSRVDASSSSSASLSSSTASTAAATPAADVDAAAASKDLMQQTSGSTNLPSPVASGSGASKDFPTSSDQHSTTLNSSKKAFNALHSEALIAGLIALIGTDNAEAARSSLEALMNIAEWQLPACLSNHVRTTRDSADPVAGSASLDPSGGQGGSRSQEFSDFLTPDHPNYPCLCCSRGFGPLQMIVSIVQARICTQQFGMSSHAPLSIASWSYSDAPELSSRGERGLGGFNPDVAPEYLPGGGRRGAEGKSSSPVPNNRATSERQSSTTNLYEDVETVPADVWSFRDAAKLQQTKELLNLQDPPGAIMHYHPLSALLSPALSSLLPPPTYGVMSILLSLLPSTTLCVEQAVRGLAFICETGKYDALVACGSYALPLLLALSQQCHPKGSAAASFSVSSPTAAVGGASPPGEPSAPPLSFSGDESCTPVALETPTPPAPSSPPKGPSSANRGMVGHLDRALLLLGFQGGSHFVVDSCANRIDVALSAWRVRWSAVEQRRMAMQRTIAACRAWESSKSHANWGIYRSLLAQADVSVAILVGVLAQCDIPVPPLKALLDAALLQEGPVQAGCVDFEAALIKRGGAEGAPSTQPLPYKDTAEDACSGDPPQSVRQKLLSSLQALATERSAAKLRGAALEHLLVRCLRMEAQVTSSFDASGVAAALIAKSPSTTSWAESAAVGAGAAAVASEAQYSSMRVATPMMSPAAHAEQASSNDTPPGLHSTLASLPQETLSGRETATQAPLRFPILLGSIFSNAFARWGRRHWSISMPFSAIPKQHDGESFSAATSSFAALSLSRRSHASGGGGGAGRSVGGSKIFSTSLRSSGMAMRMGSFQDEIDGATVDDVDDRSSTYSARSVGSGNLFSPGSVGRVLLSPPPPLARASSLGCMSPSSQPRIGREQSGWSSASPASGKALRNVSSFFPEPSPPLDLHRLPFNAPVPLLQACALLPAFFPSSDIAESVALHYAETAALEPQGENGDRDSNLPFREFAPSSPATNLAAFQRPSLETVGSFYESSAPGRAPKSGSSLHGSSGSSDALPIPHPLPGAGLLRTTVFPTTFAKDSAASKRQPTLLLSPQARTLRTTSNASSTPNDDDDVVVRIVGSSGPLGSPLHSSTFAARSSSISNSSPVAQGSNDESTPESGTIFGVSIAYDLAIKACRRCEVSDLKRSAATIGLKMYESQSFVAAGMERDASSSTSASLGDHGFLIDAAHGHAAIAPYAPLSEYMWMYSLLCHIVERSVRSNFQHNSSTLPDGGGGGRVESQRFPASNNANRDSEIAKIDLLPIFEKAERQAERELNLWSSSGFSASKPPIAVRQTKVKASGQAGGPPREAHDDSVLKRRSRDERSKEGISLSSSWVGLHHEEQEEEEEDEDGASVSSSLSETADQRFTSQPPSRNPPTSRNVAAAASSEVADQHLHEADASASSWPCFEAGILHASSIRKSHSGASSTTPSTPSEIYTLIPEGTVASAAAFEDASGQLPHVFALTHGLGIDGIGSRLRNRSIQQGLAAQLTASTIQIQSRGLVAGGAQASSRSQNIPSSGGDNEDYASFWFTIVGNLTSRRPLVAPPTKVHRAQHSSSNLRSSSNASGSSQNFQRMGAVDAWSGEEDNDAEYRDEEESGGEESLASLSDEEEEVTSGWSRQRTVRQRRRQALHSSKERGSGLYAGSSERSRWLLAILREQHDSISGRGEDEYGGFWDAGRVSGGVLPGLTHTEGSLSLQEALFLKKTATSQRFVEGNLPPSSFDALDGIAVSHGDPALDFAFWPSMGSSARPSQHHLKSSSFASAHHGSSSSSSLPQKNVTSTLHGTGFCVMTAVQGDSPPPPQINDVLPLDAEALWQSLIAQTLEVDPLSPLDWYMDVLAVSGLVGGASAAAASGAAGAELSSGSKVVDVFSTLPAALPNSKQQQHSPTASFLHIDTALTDFSFIAGGMSTSALKSPGRPSAPIVEASTPASCDATPTTITPHGRKGGYSKALEVLGIVRKSLGPVASIAAQPAMSPSDHLRMLSTGRLFLRPQISLADIAPRQSSRVSFLPVKQALFSRASGLLNESLRLLRTAQLNIEQESKISPEISLPTEMMCTSSAYVFPLSLVAETLMSYLAKNSVLRDASAAAEHASQRDEVIFDFNMTAQQSTEAWIDDVALTRAEPFLTKVGQSLQMQKSSYEALQGLLVKSAHDCADSFFALSEGLFQGARKSSDSQIPPPRICASVAFLSAADDLPGQIAVDAGALWLQKSMDKIGVSIPAVPIKVGGQSPPPTTSASASSSSSFTTSQSPHKNHPALVRAPIHAADASLYAYAMLVSRICETLPSSTNSLSFSGSSLPTLASRAIFSGLQKHWRSIRTAVGPHELLPPGRSHASFPAYTHALQRSLGQESEPESSSTLHANSAASPSIITATAISTAESDRVRNDSVASAGDPTLAVASTGRASLGSAVDESPASRVAGAHAASKQAQSALAGPKSPSFNASGHVSARSSASSRGAEVPVPGASFDASSLHFAPVVNLGIASLSLTNQGDSFDRLALQSLLQLLRDPCGDDSPISVPPPPPHFFAPPQSLAVPPSAAVTDDKAFSDDELSDAEEEEEDKKGGAADAKSGDSTSSLSASATVPTPLAEDLLLPTLDMFPVHSIVDSSTIAIGAELGADDGMPFTVPLTSRKQRNAPQCFLSMIDSPIRKLSTAATAAAAASETASGASGVHPQLPPALPPSRVILSPSIARHMMRSYPYVGLRHLTLSGNALGDNGAAEILSALADPTCPSSLASLDLSDNLIYVGTNLLEALAAKRTGLLYNNSSLRSLNLASNPLSEEVVSSIFYVLASASGTAASSTEKFLGGDLSKSPEAEGGGVSFSTFRSCHRNSAYEWNYATPLVKRSAGILPPLGSLEVIASGDASTDQNLLPSASSFSSSSFIHSLPDSSLLLRQEVEGARGGATNASASASNLSPVDLLHNTKPYQRKNRSIADVALERAGESTAHGATARTSSTGAAYAPPLNTDSASPQEEANHLHSIRESPQRGSDGRGERPRSSVTAGEGGRGGGDDPKQASGPIASRGSSSGGLRNAGGLLGIVARTFFPLSWGETSSTASPSRPSVEGGGGSSGEDPQKVNLSATYVAGGSRTALQVPPPVPQPSNAAHGGSTASVISARSASSQPRGGHLPSTRDSLTSSTFDVLGSPRLPPPVATARSSLGPSSSSLHRHQYLQVPASSSVVAKITHISFAGCGLHSSALTDALYGCMTRNGTLRDIDLRNNMLSGEAGSRLVTGVDYSAPQLWFLRLAGNPLLRLDDLHKISNTLRSKREAFLQNCGAHLSKATASVVAAAMKQQRKSISTSGELAEGGTTIAPSNRTPRPSASSLSKKRIIRPTPWHGLRDAFVEALQVPMPPAPPLPVVVPSILEAMAASLQAVGPPHVPDVSVTGAVCESASASSATLGMIGASANHTSTGDGGSKVEPASSALSSGSGAQSTMTSSASASGDSKAAPAQIQLPALATMAVVAVTRVLSCYGNPMSPSPPDASKRAQQLAGLRIDWKNPKIMLLFASPLTIPLSQSRVHALEPINLGLERRLVWDALNLQGSGVGSLKVSAGFVTGSPLETSPPSFTTPSSESRSSAPSFLDVRFLTSTVLLSALSTGADILHIACHGALDYLVLETPSGRTFGLGEASLRSMLSAGGGMRRSDGTAKVNLVVLAACHSFWAGKLLHEAGIPFIVCIKTDEEVRDVDCQDFLRFFYSSLTSGVFIEEAFDRAVQAVNISHHASTPTSSNDGSKFVLMKDGLAFKADGSSVVLFDLSADWYPPAAAAATKIDSFFETASAAAAATAAVVSASESVSTAASTPLPLSVRETPADDGGPTFESLLKGLPPLPEHFWGRNSVCQLLIESVMEHRLVTISGPPEIGKSACAIATGTWHALRRTFAKGVLYLDVRLSLEKEDFLVILEGFDQEQLNECGALWACIIMALLKAMFPSQWREIISTVVESMLAAAAASRASLRSFWNSSASSSSSTEQSAVQAKGDGDLLKDFAARRVEGEDDSTSQKGQKGGRDSLKSERLPTVRQIFEQLLDLCVEQLNGEFLLILDNADASEEEESSPYAAFNVNPALPFPAFLLTGDDFADLSDSFPIPTDAMFGLDGGGDGDAIGLASDDGEDSFIGATPATRIASREMPASSAREAVKDILTAILNGAKLSRILVTRTREFSGVQGANPFNVRIGDLSIDDGARLFGKLLGKEHLDAHGWTFEKAKAITVGLGCNPARICQEATRILAHTPVTRTLA